MDTKMIAGIVVGALVIGGGSFYGGMQYASSQTSARGAGNGQFAGRTGGAGRGAGGAAGGGFTAGTIVAMDPSSITVQLGGPNASTTNGTATGSKIVLYNAS